MQGEINFKNFFETVDNAVLTDTKCLIIKVVTNCYIL